MIINGKKISPAETIDIRKEGDKEIHITILSAKATKDSQKYKNALEVIHQDHNIGENIRLYVNEYDPQIWVEQIENGKKISMCKLY